MNPSDATGPIPRLRCAVVLSTTEDECTVFANGGRTVVPYAAFFPTPRVERVAPGQLVAIAGSVVVWRWFDAVVIESVAIDSSAAGVTLWEPAHGLAVAVPRSGDRTYRPGTRAYLSAGLPGAEWWVAGPAVERGEDADVELLEVEHFLVGLGLLDAIS